MDARSPAAAAPRVLQDRTVIRQVKLLRPTDGRERGSLVVWVDVRHAAVRPTPVAQTIVPPDGECDYTGSRVPSGGDAFLGQGGQITAVGLENRYGCMAYASGISFPIDPSTGVFTVKVTVGLAMDAPGLFDPGDPTVAYVGQAFWYGLQGGSLCDLLGPDPFPFALEGS